MKFLCDVENFQGGFLFFPFFSQRFILSENISSQGFIVSEDIFPENYYFLLGGYSFTSFFTQISQMTQIFSNSLLSSKLNLCLIPLVSYQISSRINSKEDEKQDGETPKRTTTITEEWQRNTNDRSETQHHSHIDEQVEEEDTQYAIAIHSSELEGLSLCQMNQP